MRLEIQKYIQECRNCQLKEPRKNSTIYGSHGYTTFDEVSMDIVEPLSINESEHSYTLTIQDLLKYSMAVLLKQAIQAEITEALVEKFIDPKYTAPKAWITDQNPNFISNVMRYVAYRYKISIYKTPTYWPQSNKSIERSHHVLIEYLKQ